MDTPYFVIDESVLRQNIDVFRNALGCFWSNSRLAYSLKTNCLPWVVKYIRECGCIGEVVSKEELNIALHCGYTYDNIIYNGPIKDMKTFNEAMNNGSVVNIDSKVELLYIQEGNYRACENLGIRVNLDLCDECPEDIGFQNEGFRFGFSENNGELEAAIFALKSNNIHRFGLHFHCNSVTRSTKVYNAIARHAVKIINTFKLKPSFIDMGGGFFGGVPGKPTAYDYLKNISTILKEVVSPTETTLILEPGSAIISSAVNFVTCVKDVKDTSKARIVTTDGSRINLDALFRKKKYLCSFNTRGKVTSVKQIICGYTCMDMDRIMVLENSPELSVGDEIIYERVGGYTMTFGGPFIRFFPEVYVLSEGKMSKVRQYLNTDDYIKIHSC